MYLRKNPVLLSLWIDKVGKEKRDSGKLDDGRISILMEGVVKCRGGVFTVVVYV